MLKPERIQGSFKRIRDDSKPLMKEAVRKAIEELKAQAKASNSLEDDMYEFYHF